MLAERIIAGVGYVGAVEACLRTELRRSQEVLHGGVTPSHRVQWAGLALVVEPSDPGASDAHRLGQLRDQVRGDLQGVRIHRDPAVVEVVNQGVGPFYFLRESKVAL